MGGVKVIDVAVFDYGALIRVIVLLPCGKRVMRSIDAGALV